MIATPPSVAVTQCWPCHGPIGTGGVVSVGISSTSLGANHHCMRGPKESVCAAAANLFCRAHGFMRNVPDGFYRWGLVLGDPRIPWAPRLVLAWEKLTQELQAA
jgi:hypothetical protein